ncbi:acyl-CoA thioester hydrolase [Clostridium tetanomorphum]|uniref:Acyl-CoA thioesterase n=1 Tax=Clostridium tetanomorphum TaxID=1553 RepID=A0A923J0J5_CLOTT|nr:thioesterase family protein [Clostridium tetanomorphum]KAJ50873.1 thioesterase family protein [Clostridium tetanomorphum DSM 665]MBC2398366.1 acyl-CoA thioesterase [Clostridium tetanomorphum]MBP1865519.1 acyl-CoA thioester hydrolase [Clostridium tetanomorphum]NRS86465.1 acyl-CoA thioester hydrolase [Clostridium tetanomorphum]NRZ95506.1 acyl-CoA thioester hydrolase [Clostridium tetanomorphum]
MYINRTELKVRYVETDKMGIVHHSNYYPWFEVGRGEFILESKMSYKELEENGIMMPLVETYCKYIEAAKYEDIIIVETYIKELTAAKVIFNYNVIRKEDNKLLAKGYTTQVFVDNRFKIVNLKRKHPDAWERLVELC